MSEYQKSRLFDLVVSLNDALDTLRELERVSSDTEISDILCHVTQAKNILIRYRKNQGGQI